MSAPEIAAFASDWSRQHCGAICTVLVPANLLATLATLWLLVRSDQRLRGTALLGSGLAVVLALHVSTWLAIGVVTPVTFVLFSLGAICLTTQAAAVWLHQYQPQRVPQVARWAVQVVAVTRLPRA